MLWLKLSIQLTNNQIGGVLIDSSNFYREINMKQRKMYKYGNKVVSGNEAAMGGNNPKFKTTKGSMNGMKSMKDAMPKAKPC